MYTKLKIVFLSLLLSGCGTQFVYNNITLISPWYVDDYVDLNRDQMKRFKAHLRELQAWHRDSELPRYREVLVNIQGQLANPELESQALLAQLYRMSDAWDVIVQQATPAVVELSQSLTDAQRTQLFEAMERRNQERLEQGDSDKQPRQAWIERIEKWMGRLSDTQQHLVAEYADSVPNMDELTVAAHRNFQARLFELMEQSLMADYGARMGVLLAGAMDSDEGRLLEQARQQQLQERVELFVELWRRADDSQRRKVLKKLAGYQKDVEALMQAPQAKAA